MANKPLVLASASPYRVELLRRLGIPFEAHPHKYDEASLDSGQLEPPEIALALARAKAVSLAADFPGRRILGSDQVLDLDGEILGKPGSRPAAVGQLRRLRGRAHRLLTAVVLLEPDGTERHAVDVHTLAMRPLTDEAIEDYVDRDRPLDCCGAYKIESLGIALFESIAGDDFTAITGLPLMAVVRMLGESGVEVLG